MGPENCSLVKMVSKIFKPVDNYSVHNNKFTSMPEMHSFFGKYGKIKFKKFKITQNYKLIFK